MSDVLSLVDPQLLNALNDLAKQDIIIQNCLEKTNSEQEFINSLIAAIICISDRELSNVEKLETLLKNNPQIVKFLGNQNDQSLLCDKSKKL
jgi:hypothetical protein